MYVTIMTHAMYPLGTGLLPVCLFLPIMLCCSVQINFLLNIMLMLCLKPDCSISYQKII